MTLQQLFDKVNKRSYQSRADDEILSAISSASKLLYNKILNENRGNFTKWDTTFVSIAVGQEDYALPPDLQQIVRFRERADSSSPYRIIEPADINSNDFIDAQFASIVGADQDGPVSDFMYYGPILLEADAQTVLKQRHIRLAPTPQDTRQTELVYTAKFIEITSLDDFLTIPDEGHEAVMYYAAADLKVLNDDDNTGDLTMAQMHEREFLKIVRKNQTQKGPQVEPYIDDLD